MCNPASFVLTKDRVFWSMFSDSHETIIEEFGLHESSRLLEPNILRLEITPPIVMNKYCDKRPNFAAPLDTWNYKVDQDIMPPWYDAETAKVRATMALKEWYDARVFSNNPPKDLSNGRFWLLDRAFAFLRTNAVAYMYDYSQAVLHCNAEATLFDKSVASLKDHSRVILHNESQAKAYGESCVIAYADATMHLFGSSRGALYKNAKAIIQDSAVLEQFNGTVKSLDYAAVIIDRRASQDTEPKCITASTFKRD